MEDGEEDGVAHGPATVHSAIYRLGRDPDGYMVEERVGGSLHPTTDTGIGLPTTLLGAMVGTRLLPITLGGRLVLGGVSLLLPIWLPSLVSRAPILSLLRSS